jgi:hypothetical protein
METKTELLKKLGFSEDYLQFVSNENDPNDYRNNSDGQYSLDVITINTSEIVYPVIEMTQEPINSYIN